MSTVVAPVSARRLWRHGTLPQLAAFDAIMRLGSFADAAQALHMAQPTVSGHVRKLSDAMGLPLFEPQGRRMVPTPAAHVLRRVAQDVFDALARADAALTPLRQAGGARQRLSVAVGTHAAFAAAVLAPFACAWPQVDVSLHVHNHAELCRRHAAGLDDVVVISAPRPAKAGRPPGGSSKVAEPHLLARRLPAGLHTQSGPGLRPLWPHPLALCVGASHRLAAASAAPAWAEVLDETFLLREPGSALRQSAEELFAARGRRPRQEVELSSNEALRQAVAAGVGVALVSGHALPTQDGEGLHALRLPGLPLPRRWHALLRPDSQQHACVQAFVTLLEQLKPP